MYSGQPFASQAEARRSRFFHVPHAAPQPAPQVQQQQPEPRPASASFSQLAQAYLRKSKAQDTTTQWSNPNARAPSSFTSYSSYKAHAAWVPPLTPLPQTELETLERVYRYHATRNITAKMKGQTTRDEKPKQSKRREKGKKAKKHAAPASDAMSISSDTEASDHEAVYVQYFPGTKKEYCEEVISLPRPTPSLSPEMVPMELEDALDRPPPMAQQLGAQIPQDAIRMDESMSNVGGSLGFQPQPTAVDAQQGAAQRESSKKFFAAVLQRRTQGKSAFQPRGGQPSMDFSPSR